MWVETASTLISATALAGVAVSLLLQGRQTRAAEALSMRQEHRELVRLAIDDPGLQPCWGGTGASRHTGDSYTNLIVSFWWASYDIGFRGDADMRGVLRTFFEGEQPRRWWDEYGRDRWMLSRTSGRFRNGRYRRFVRFVEDEYQRAVAAGPPIVPATRPGSAAERD